MYRPTRAGAGTAAAGATLSTSLPVTGADLVALVLLGAVLIIVGFVLLRLRLRDLAEPR